MIGNKELLNNLEERNLQLHMELGDDGRYSTKGIGIVTFKRELSSHIKLNTIMYVLGLKKLVSIVVPEDKGYGVVFSKGKAYLKHVATRQVNQIFVQVKHFYKLEVDACFKLSSNEKHVKVLDVGEL